MSLTFETLLDEAIAEITGQTAEQDRAEALDDMLALMAALGLEGLPLPIDLLADAAAVAPGLYAGGAFGGDLSRGGLERAAADGAPLFALGILGGGMAGRRLVYRVVHGGRAMGGDIPVLNPVLDDGEAPEPVAARGFLAQVMAVLQRPALEPAGVAPVAFVDEQGELDLAFVGPGGTRARVEPVDDTAPFGGLFDVARPSVTDLVRRAMGTV